MGDRGNKDVRFTGEDPMLSDQHQYRYMTVDDMKSMGDDSMRVNVTDDERDNRHAGGKYRFNSFFFVLNRQKTIFFDILLKVVQQQQRENNGCKIVISRKRHIFHFFLFIFFIAPTITEMITKENYQRTNAAILKPDNIDINRHPVHVGYVFDLYYFVYS